jgi:hypothetical protein
LSNDLSQLADEAIQLEYNVSKLYMIFRDAHQEDSEFWWKLVIEESNHAALIRSGKDFFMQAKAFPAEILPASIEELQQANKDLMAALDKYESNPPTREKAFNVALRAEMDAGEIHFQKAMTKSSDSKLLILFQKLNQDDKDHIKRIRDYMNKHGIQETI